MLYGRRCGAYCGGEKCLPDQVCAKVDHGDEGNDSTSAAENHLAVDFVLLV